MAEKNIQMTQRNSANTGWDDLFPKTKAGNVSITPISGLTGADVQTALKNLFQFANDGKTAVANAVTAKGVSASPADTFAALATKIGQISTGKQKATGKAYPKTGGGITVDSLTFKPGLVVFFLSGNSSLSVYDVSPYMVTAIDQAIPLQYINNENIRGGKNLVMSARQDKQGSNYDLRLIYRPTTEENKMNGIWERWSNFEAKNNGFYLATPGSYLSENIEHTWIAYEL
ncbi:hypothetical protein [Lysinibacillus xylanilyticus]|uniref:hypothetical protein n=1 Tax=Lysinibacillus xylanilyticus TaxID=582475 RepID=UPI0037F9B847